MSDETVYLKAQRKRCVNLDSGVNCSGTEFTDAPPCLIWGDNDCDRLGRCLQDGTYVDLEGRWELLKELPDVPTRNMPVPRNLIPKEIA